MNNKTSPSIAEMTDILYLKPIMHKGPLEWTYSGRVALIQSENHAANKEKTAGKYQFDTHPTRIGLSWCFIACQFLKNLFWDLF